jgi:putative intracellular protease/amidase
VVRFVQSMWERGDIVSAVCHGSAALTNVTLTDGSYLVAADGSPASPIKKSVEQMAGLDKFVPFYLQDRLVERGARFDESEPFTPNVPVDGNLLTGQQPASAGLLAATIVERLTATPTDPAGARSEHV